MRSFFLSLLCIALSCDLPADESELARGTLANTSTLGSGVLLEQAVDDLHALLEALKRSSNEPQLQTEILIKPESPFSATSSMEYRWSGPVCIIQLNEALLPLLSKKTERMGFVLAHELTHCLHRDGVAAHAAHIQNPLSNWQREYSADLGAAILMKKLNLDVLEGLTVLNFFGTICSKTHPSHLARMQALTTGQRTRYSPCLASN